MKRIFLVFLGALLLFPFSSALADVGVSVNTGLASGQNLFYGNAKNSNQGNLMLLQSRDNTNEFIFDRDGNFWASSSIRAKNICNQDASYCFSPIAGGFDVTNDSWSGTGNITMTSGSVGIGTVSPSQMLDVYGGNIRTTGTIYANANGTAYLCGGDDACLNDINVANTVGLYGVQNGAIGSLRLGSSGATVSGNSSGDTSVNRDLYVSTHGGTGITLIGDSGYINRVRAGTGGNMMLQSDSATVIAGGWNSNEAKVIIYPGVDIYGHVNLGGQNDPSNDQGNNWLTWGYRADNNPYYAIRTNYKTYGSYTYSRLQIGWHTGIEIGAASSYGGTRFYNNSPFTGSQIMSIGDGDSNVRVSNDLLVSGNIGIGSNSPAAKLDVLVSGTSAYYAINAKNTATHQGRKIAIYAESTTPVGDNGDFNNFHMGVWGYAAGTAMRNYGLMGAAEGATTNVGVVGVVGFNSAFPSGNWSGWFAGAPLYVENNIAIGTKVASNKLIAVDLTTYNDTPAVRGVHAVTDYYGIGVEGEGKYMGVKGTCSAYSGNGCYGGYFQAYSGSSNSVGIYASGATFAGDFRGNVSVSGILSKGGGSFLIDNPLNPKEENLQHSFVESPEMRNLYYGQAETVNGRVEITLPEWWQALNGKDKAEYNYQMTPMGKWCNLYVAEEIENNKFAVGTNDGNCKFSWQVSAIRHDAFAEKNRIPVVTEKEASQKGACIHPEACK